MKRDMLSRRLGLEGSWVAMAASGSESLRLLNKHTFDAVRLDVMMPGQNGYEVLAETGKTHSSWDLPAPMGTAKNQNEGVINPFEVAANDYLTRPINFSVALARINCHVASKFTEARRVTLSVAQEEVEGSG